MKKTVIILTLGLSSLFYLPSCKKNYDCVCSINGEEVSRTSLGKQKRSDAKDACEAKATGLGVIAKCEID